MIVMIVLPQAYMLDYSFRHNLPPGKIGGPEDVYTLANYRYLLFGSPTSPDAFNYLHLEVFLRTIVVSVFLTLLDFALCYPIAGSEEHTSELQSPMRTSHPVSLLKQ